jgi:hypothetical protein
VIVAHIGGLPAEETIAQLAPAGIAVLVAVRALRGRTRRWTSRLQRVRTRLLRTRSAWLR